MRAEQTKREEINIARPTRQIGVAFYVYPTAYQNPGGGEVQLQKTKEYLEHLGLEIKLFDTWHHKLQEFDILHTFGSVKDCLPMMEEARRKGVKNVLSSICWYSWKSAWGTYTNPKARTVSMVRHGAKVFLPFLPSRRKRMFEIADAVLPNSHSEAGQLVRFFGVSKNKIHVVPNGVDERFTKADPAAFIEKYKLKDFILCAGRIEPRKNQLNAVRALRGIGRPVVFIGGPVPAYQDYYEACRREAGPDVHFLGQFDHGSELLMSAYAACGVFLLATWLETPGLAALEAALAGAKIVITQEGATREYFGHHAVYVNPADAGDIRAGTLKAISKTKDASLQDHVKRRYLWTETAKLTLEAYRRVLTNGEG